MKTILVIKISKFYLENENYDLIDTGFIRNGYSAVTPLGD